jgi:hypothetical protein
MIDCCFCDRPAVRRHKAEFLSPIDACEYHMASASACLAGLAHMRSHLPTADNTAPGLQPKFLNVTSFNDPEPVYLVCSQEPTVVPLTTAVESYEWL